jgi:hypothetical protein
VRELHCQSSQHEPLKRAYNSLNCETPYNLCFLRHGQSTWNRDNRFIGWTDTVSRGDASPRAADTFSGLLGLCLVASLSLF